MERFPDNGSVNSGGGGGGGTAGDGGANFNEDFWTSSQGTGNNMCPIFGAAHAENSSFGLEPLGIPNFGGNNEGGYGTYPGFDESFWDDLYAQDTPNEFLQSTPRFNHGKSPGGELDFTNDTTVGQQERQQEDNAENLAATSAAVPSSGQPVYRAGGQAQGASGANNTEANAGTYRTRSTRGVAPKRKQPAPSSEGKDDEDADFQHSSDSVRAAAYEAKRKADAEYENEVGVDAKSSNHGESSSNTKSRRKGVSKEEKSRERNRVHARKSRLRKKFFLDSLKTNLEALENENKRLKEFIKNTTGKSYDQVSGGSSNSSQDASILEGPQQKATKKLEDIDYQLVQALTISQQNFVVSDPKLADNPIVFASQGFYQLTGYSPQEVIGRNCRFLQGPSTDPDTVAVIRQGIEEGTDTAVCLINYKKDGTPFWNQFFVAPLRGVDGNVVNYIGVQCEVSEKVANASIKSAKQTGAYQGAQGESSGSQFATGIQSVIQGRD